MPHIPTLGKAESGDLGNAVRKNIRLSYAYNEQESLHKRCIIQRSDRLHCDLPNWDPFGRIKADRARRLHCIRRHDHLHMIQRQGEMDRKYTSKRQTAEKLIKEGHQGLQGRFIRREKLRSSSLFVQVGRQCATRRAVRDEA